MPPGSQMEVAARGTMDAQRDAGTQADTATRGSSIKILVNLKVSGSNCGGSRQPPSRKRGNACLEHMIELGVASADARIIRDRIPRCGRGFVMQPAGMDVQ